MKLPRDVERMAERQSLLSAQRMADFEAKKDGGDWTVLKLGGVVTLCLACVGFVVYSLFGLLR